MPINKYKPDNLPKSSTGDPFYQSKQWRDFRAKRMQKDAMAHTILITNVNTTPIPPDYNYNKPCCEVCYDKDRIVNGVVYDHIVPRSQGGPDYPPPEGMQWLCHSCHNRKRQTERINKYNDIKK